MNTDHTHKPSDPLLNDHLVRLPLAELQTLHRIAPHSPPPAQERLLARVEAETWSGLLRREFAAERIWRCQGHAHRTPDEALACAEREHDRRLNEAAGGVWP